MRALRSRMAGHIEKFSSTRAVGAVGTVLFVLIQIAGLAAFAAPFVNPQEATNEAFARAGDAPLVLGVTLCALFALLGLMRVNARHIAVLGILCAVNSALRLVEVTVLPLPGGFSPMFLLIIVSGYAYGARFGFLTGAFSLLSSALITGGVGPWLPFEMFGAGWVGLTAGLISDCRFRISDFGLPIAHGRSSITSGADRQSTIENRQSKIDLVFLLPFGFVWGFVYGALLNLYFWPVIDAGAGISYQAGVGIGDALQRYAAFYVTTSLWWDVFSAIGNAALLAWLGLPLLRALQRFGRRFQFEVAPQFSVSD